VLIEALGVPCDEAVGWVTPRNSLVARCAARCQRVAGIHGFEVIQTTYADERSTDLTAVFDGQPEDCVEDEKRIDDQVAMTVSFCVFAIEIERIEAQRQACEEYGVALEEGPAPVMSFDLADLEVFVQAPLRPGSRSLAKIIGHASPLLLREVVRERSHAASRGSWWLSDITYMKSVAGRAHTVRTCNNSAKVLVRAAGIRRAQRMEDRVLTLFQFPTSPFCEKVRRILGYKKVSYEIHNVPRAKVSEYARVSPTGKFPAIDHDGNAVWDSTDIARYLEIQFPERPLIPSDPRFAALVHILEDWADESLYFYEVTMRLAWEHNAPKSAKEFAASIPGMTADTMLPLLTKGAQAIASAQGIGRKPRNQVVNDAERQLEALEALLEGRRYLVGDDMTLADIAVLAQLNALAYAEEINPVLDRLPSVRSWRARVSTEAPG